VKNLTVKPSHIQYYSFLLVTLVVLYIDESVVILRISYIILLVLSYYIYLYIPTYYCKFFFCRLMLGISSGVLVYYTPYFISSEYRNWSVYFFLIYELHRILRLVNNIMYYQKVIIC